MLRLALALGPSLLAAPVAAASVDGIEIHSTVEGAGPKTVIFVHGWTCDQSSWAGQLPAFDDEYRVVTLDYPGHVAAPALSVFAGGPGFGNTEATKEVVPNWSSEKFGDNGHFLMMEDPARFNAVLRAFLEQRARF